MKWTKTIGITTIIGLVLAAIIILLFLNFIPLIILTVSLPKFTQGLATDGGLNHWLAQALAIVFTVFLVLGGHFIFKRPGTFSGKTLKLICFSCLILACYSLTIYFLQRDRTEAIQKKSAAWNTGPVAKFAHASIDRNTLFFDPVTRQPLVWYYQDDQGRLEFFTSAGVHPQFNQPLKPIDAPTVKQFLAYLDTGRTDMILGLPQKTPQTAIAQNLPISANKKPSLKPIWIKPAVGTKASKKSVDTRPFHQVLRQQLSIELDQLGTFLCQAQQLR